MDKDIEITSIEIKEEISSNAINVEIINEPEVLIAAHNANPTAHNALIEKVEGKIAALNGTINELEENMALSINLPTKISDLENDIPFVSEQTLISAIETRGLINNTTLAQKETEIKNLIDINNNIYNTKFENITTKIKDATNPILITNYCVPSTKRIALITAHTSQALTLTMPANGIFHCIGQATGANGLFVLTRLDVAMDQTALIASSGHYGTLEILVRKGEKIKISPTRCTIHDITFYYLGGNAPKDNEEETA